MLARLTCIAMVAAAPLAMAQEPAKEIPATAEELAAARAIGDRLIAAADGEGIFVNITDGKLAKVAHVASGLTCLFEGGRRDRISIFSSGDPKIPRGDDVACVSRDEALQIDLSLYATRYRPLPSEAAVLADAQRAIAQRWPDARPYAEGLPSLMVEGRSPTLMAAYKVQIEGADMLTLVLVTHREEWGYKARATGPLSGATLVGLYAGVMLEGALQPRRAD